MGTRGTWVARSALRLGEEPELGAARSVVFAAEGIEILADNRTERVSGDGDGVAVAVETPTAGRILRAQRRLGATFRHAPPDQTCRHRNEAELHSPTCVVG